MNPLFNTHQILCAAVCLTALGAASSAALAQHPWQPQPNKASLMVVHAHPDDEGIFFGGVLPYYTQVQQRDTVLVNMVSDRVGHDLTVRENELRNAAWTYGLRNEPIFARFLDHAHLPGGTNSLNNAWNAWDGDDANGVADSNSNGVPDGREAGALFLAEQIRQFRPDVVVTHDFDGEYGHGAHRAAAFTTADAWALAADASINIDGLPVWQAQKLYIHKYGGNRLFHTGFEDTYPELGGLTPRQIANLGLDEHVTQGRPNVSTFFLSGENWDGHDSERWGLYASTVGPDSTGNGVIGSNVHYGDFFENVVETPEPGALMLFGFASLTLLRRRQRAV